MRQRQIAAATVIGALLAAACLLWEQQSSAALMINGKVDARAMRPTFGGNSCVGFVWDDPFRVHYQRETRLPQAIKAEYVRRIYAAGFKPELASGETAARVEDRAARHVGHTACRDLLSVKGTAAIQHI